MFSSVELSVFKVVHPSFLRSPLSYHSLLFISSFQTGAMSASVFFSKFLWRILGASPHHLIGRACAKEGFTVKCLPLASQPQPQIQKILNQASRNPENSPRGSRNPTIPIQESRNPDNQETCQVAGVLKLSKPRQP